MAAFVFGMAASAKAEVISVADIIEATGNGVEQSTIIVERQSDKQVWISNPRRAEDRFSPASTAKIPHTLIALENGLATVETVFTWDGVLRSARVWNRDQTLASAFQNSTVWVYQDIARAAGPEAMAKGLRRFAYGNTDVGSAEHLTTYWLDDTLKISAVEQIGFLGRLASKTLPLKGSTYDASRNIMVSDQGGGWVMRSKTGWRHSDNSMDIGWFVGWLECPKDVYVFAMNIDMPDTRYLSRRKSITYAVLQNIGAFDCR